MCAAALQQAKLDAANLDAGEALLHDGSEQSRETAELRVTKAVACGGLGLRDKAAVGIVDALGHRHENLAVGLINLIDVGNELIHIEIAFGEVHEIRAGAEVRGQSGARRQPARVTTHDLNNGDHAVVVNSGVLIDLHAARCDIFCCAAEAGAVISAVKVVVNGLGDAHDAALVADGFHIAADLCAGVHGIVAAVIEEIADVVLLEYLKNALIIGVIILRSRYLITAGAKLGGRSVQQELKLCRILLIHDEQLVVENSDYTVRRAVHLGDVLGFKRSLDNTVRAGVDDRSRPPRLTENTCPYQFPIHFYFLPFIEIFRKIFGFCQMCDLIIT